MDARAFERLVRDHQQMVYAVALSHCKDATAAEDLAQEAFLKAYRSMDGLKHPSQLKTWLYSIARFTAIDWLRRRKREEVRPLPEVQAAPEAAGGESEDRAMRVMSVIQGLRDDYREIMLLRYVRGLSYAEIAKTVGGTPSAIGEKLHRVREMVREKLRPEVRS
jgi:RNA polymerase sigma-70 factor (ECF subfamily)